MALVCSNTVRTRCLTLQRFDKNIVASPPSASPSCAADLISARERKVLRMVANGYTSAEIGSHMLISSMTVNSHVKSIYRKLHVHTRAQAVSFAAIWGLL